MDRVGSTGWDVAILQCWVHGVTEYQWLQDAQDGMFLLQAVGIDVYLRCDGVGKLTCLLIVGKSEWLEAFRIVEVCLHVLVSLLPCLVARNNHRVGTVFAGELGIEQGEHLVGFCINCIQIGYFTILHRAFHTLVLINLALHLAHEDILQRVGGHATLVLAGEVFIEVRTEIHHALHQVQHAVLAQNIGTIHCLAAEHVAVAAALEV